MNLKRIHPSRLIPVFCVSGFILSVLLAAIDSESAFPTTLRETIEWVLFFIIFTSLFFGTILVCYSILWGILFIVKFVISRVWAKEESQR